MGVPDLDHPALALRAGETDRRRVVRGLDAVVAEEDVFLKEIEVVLATGPAPRPS